MSNPESERAQERIQDSLIDHIDEFFTEPKNDKILLDFIFENEAVKNMLWECISESKLGQKIGQGVFDNLPEGPEDDPREDR